MLLSAMHRRLTLEMAAMKVWADVEELIMLEKIKEAEGVGLTTTMSYLGLFAPCLLPHKDFGPTIHITKIGPKGKVGSAIYSGELRLLLLDYFLLV